MTWKGNEREIAEKVILVLQSDKYKSKNYLFLAPFDLSQVPGYLDVVEKPMDLQTVTNQLQAGHYDDDPSGAAMAFWNDVSIIFQNAIQYHADKPTKWIAKFAKDMLKIVHKERKSIENPDSKDESLSKNKIKLLLKPMSAQTGSALAGFDKNFTAGNSNTGSRKPSLSLSPGMTGDGEEMSVSAKKSKPKISLKLKLGSSSTPTSTSSGKADSDEIKAMKEPTKLSEKGSDQQPALKPSKKLKEKPDGKDSTKKVIKAKPTHTKLRLTLKPKTASETETMKSNVSPKQSSVQQDATLPKGSTPKSIAKINPAAGQSRGKELPAAVLEQQIKEQKKKDTSQKDQSKSGKESKKEKKENTAKKRGSVSKEILPAPAKATGKTKKAKNASSSAMTQNENTCLSSMTLDQQKQCAKVLAGLRRRQNKQIGWFSTPVSDKSILQDYRAKIKHPMDLSTVQTKLDKSSGNYGVKEFVLDVRRIFSNCLIFNTSIKDSLRPVAVEVLETAEMLMKAFLAPEDATASPYPPLLFCWKLCIDIIDTLYNLVNPSDGQPTALYFQHPVSCYCGGKFPQGYLDKIAKPMDFGTVTSNLLEGRYQSVEDFSVDCRLVISNCNTYYQDQEGGSVYIEQANRLNEYLARQLDQLARYAKSSKGASDRTRSLQTPSLPRPPAEVLLSIVEEMKSIKYTDKATKITEAAMGPFEKPVSLAAFPDYPIHVKEPVDLQAIERKVGSDQYSTVEDFEYDFYLMFRNCEVYNAQRGGDHLVSMAKHGAKQFRKIFYSKIRGFEDPSSFSPPKPETALASSKDEVQPPLKKIKINPIGASKGKTAPRLSIPASHSNLGADERPVAKSPKTVATGTQKKAGATIMTPKPSQPVPLHIAIARVKEAFPLRRAVKSLQLWEADCARYFKELMRHPWISAARPKFIFHVPVPDLFPELKDAYAQKIRKPMDLTTVECTLLAGNRYATPEDFIQDIALVFANAVRFNKDGRDIGDPLSCAYYDASVHLLRYSRWLSLELLQAHIDETSEYVDDVGPDGLPPSSWKLTAGNRRKARDEMEALVMKEPIEKSLEGDRYTWMETECEKLLKALRHQSDLRHMTFFIQPNYPADYTAFIARPMDWEKVQRTLKKRQYDCFNDIVSDLRLIFSNALKYNARLKGTDTVSGRAYESARYMSNKLEIAINKMVLAVSDRLERERIDHANAEREIEAAERAEEAIIRAAWKKERGQDGSSPTPPQGDIAQKNRLVRRAAQRREAADFEMPFFDDEDNGQHESSYFEVVKLQKSIYEKQTQELQKMRQVANKLGGNMLVKIFQRHRALEWVANEAKVTLSNMRHVVAIPSGEPDIPRDKQLTSSGSVALVELQNEGRARIQVKLNWAGPKRKARIKQQRSDLDACAFD